jgi:hypothetical protein
MYLELLNFSAVGSEHKLVGGGYRKMKRREGVGVGQFDGGERAIVLHSELGDRALPRYWSALRRDDLAHVEVSLLGCSAAASK